MCRTHSVMCQVSVEGITACGGCGLAMLLIAEIASDSLISENAAHDFAAEDELAFLDGYDLSPNVVTLVTAEGAAARSSRLRIGVTLTMAYTQYSLLNILVAEVRGLGIVHQVHLGWVGKFMIGIGTLV